MYAEFKKSVEHVFNERLSSPLFGSFIFSWLAWNWDILIFLFKSNHTVLWQIYIVKQLASWNKCLIYPCISSLAIVVLYPIFSSAIYYFHLWFDKWKYERKLEAEKVTPLHPNRAFELRKGIADIKSEIEKTIQEKDDQLLKASDDNDKLRGDLNEQVKKYTSLSDENNEYIKKVQTLQDSNRELQVSLGKEEQRNREKEARFDEMKINHKEKENSSQLKIQNLTDQLNEANEKNLAGDSALSALSLDAGMYYLETLRLLNITEDKVKLLWEIINDHKKGIPRSLLSRILEREQVDGLIERAIFLVNDSHILTLTELGKAFFLFLMGKLFI